MKDERLREYEEREIAFITSHTGDVAQRGHIQSATELYPDLSFPANIAFARGSVPLPLVLLLHDKLVLYIPPTSSDFLQQRWRMPVNSVLELCQQGLIQPIIGHPTNYRFEHFKPFLDLNPPSVWARGLGLLRVLGLEEKLAEARRELPLYKMASLAWVRKRWKRHFPGTAEEQLTKLIALEFSTQYADLWLFGLGKIASHLKDLGAPSRIARALLMTNEFKTYPTLLGLDGTGHYDLETVRTDRALLGPGIEERGAQTLLVPPDLEILLKGVGVSLQELTPEDIVEFHASGDGDHLRKAITRFDRNARESMKDSRESGAEKILDSAEDLQTQIRDAVRMLSDPSFRRKAKATETRISWLFRVAALSLGAFVGQQIDTSPLAMMEGAGFGALLYEAIVPKKFKEGYSSLALAERFGFPIAHLWRLASKHRGGSDQ